jgi:hypothetical protein
VAHFLEAPLEHCVKRFWSLLPGSNDHAWVLPAVVQQALSDTHADVAAAVCRGHPRVADNQLTLSQKLVCLPPALSGGVRCGRAHGQWHA